MSWRSLDSADLEREYSPSSCLDRDIAIEVEAYRSLSDAARQRCADLGATLTTITYGDEPAETVDLAVPPGVADAPLVLYFHGGYWQQLSKFDSFFAAADAVERGWAFAAVDYTLAPAASLDEIVTECRTATGRIVERAEALRIDPAEIVLAGSSAGAHLAAMTALDPDGPPIAGALLVSGVYDLEPIVHTYVNDALGLDLDGARRNSPMLHDLTGFPPTVVAYGDNETAEFKRQSNDFASNLRRAGTDAPVVEVAGRHHFDVIHDLCRPTTPLSDVVASLLAAP